jgi:hypothetical protein
MSVVPEQTFNNNKNNKITVIAELICKQQYRFTMRICVLYRIQHLRAGRPGFDSWEGQVFFIFATALNRLWYEYTVASYV